MSRHRALAANLGLSLLVLALMLLMMEGIARFFRARRGGGKEQNEFAQYQVHDPVLGWRNQPGARVLFRRREYEVELRTNSQGLRDRERSYEGSSFRILGLGDSFLEGYSVPLERTVTQVLEKALDRPGCPVEVINGGVSAYSADQEYLAYREEGMRYGPRVVALFFYYNDVLPTIGSVQYGRPKPLLDFRATPPRIANHPVPPPPPAPPPGPRPEPEGSALLDWTQERLQRLPRVYNAIAKLGVWRPIRPVHPPHELNVYWRRVPPDVEQAWRQVDRILGALAEEAARRNARLLVVYIPSRFEVSDRELELTRMWYGLDPSSWGRGPVLRRLNGIAAARGFPVLDLTGDLRKADGGLLGGPYFEHDGHWNPLGHQVAATALQGWLSAQGWLPPCASSNSSPQRRGGAEARREQREKSASLRSLR